MDDLATLEAFGDVGAAPRAAGRRRARSTWSPTRTRATARAAWARGNAAGRPVRTVQHHHAHVAAVMAEHGLDGREPVIGVAFDGTGYGTDGAVWGGEVLVADYKGFRRVAHLGYVPLPGGDASVHRPYRMALAHLRAAGLPWDPDLAPVAACPADEQAVLAHQVESGFGCVPTSSMGRLFDAVASLRGVRHVVDYEAQAAIELEGRARGVDVGGAGGYAFACRSGPRPARPWPTRPRWSGQVVEDLRRGVPAELVAARFHAAVVDLVVDLAEQARAASGLSTVALCGGVFGNALLLSAARRGAASTWASRAAHRRAVPPNDGGLALGQLMVASLV